MADSITLPQASASSIDTRRPNQIVGVAGLGFSVTFVGWLAIVFDGPRFNEPASAVRTYLETDPALLRVAPLVLGLTMLLFGLPFVVTVFKTLQGDQGDVTSSIIVPLAAMSFSFWMLDAALGSAAALLGADQLSEATLEGIWNISRVVNGSLVHLTMGLWVAATSWRILQTQLFPRWLGWLGLALLGPQLVAASWLLGGTFTDLHDGLGGLGALATMLLWVPGLAVSALKRS